MRPGLSPFLFGNFFKLGMWNIFCATIFQSCFTFSQTGNADSLSLEVLNDRARLNCRTDENSAWVLQGASSLAGAWFPLVDFVIRDSTFETPITESRGFFRLQQLPTSGALSRIGLANGGMVLNLPAGQHGPSQNPYVSPKIPAVPKVVAGNTDPVPTCSWWSSLVWDFGNSGPSGFPLFAWPLGYRPSNQGMDLGLPSVKAISAYEYHWEFVYGAAGELPLRIGPVGMSSPSLQVVRWGDWTVTIRWTSGSNSMDATIGMGIPWLGSPPRGANWRSPLLLDLACRYGGTQETSWASVCSGRNTFFLAQPARLGMAPPLSEPRLPVRSPLRWFRTLRPPLWIVFATAPPQLIPG